MEPTLIITSPNSQFTDMARSVSEELRFKAIIIEAVLDQAVELILAACRQHEVSGVISRGGTANMIRQALDIPVLVAEANDFDILTALLDAAEVSPKIAYVLSADYAIEELAWVAERFKINMQPYVFRNVEELEKAVVQARRDGCRVVVSGSDNARRACDQYGLPCFLVNTSRRTMVELVRRAMLIAEVRDREIANRKKLSITLDLVPESVFFLDSDDRVSLVNHHGLDLLELKGEGEIVGRLFADFIDNPAFLKTLVERQPHSGRVTEFAGKTLLSHSAPVFVQKKYLGMVLSLQRASEVERLEHRVRREAHSAGLTAESTFTDMEKVAASPAMRACLKRARQFAASEGTILITGESGTGKELLVQSIHNGSTRRDQAFVAINCAALPLTLLESELFGYEEGSFTGARRGGKPGYFELAHGGTLFLDELGLLPLHVQMQLLRVLQSRQVLRVGGRKMIPVDVRVVAATNADLAALVADGTFRQDLYYRINVLHLAIPPLRERPEDIPLLAGLYLPRFSRENGRDISGLSPALVRLFQAHSWPGNVREFLNYLMRLVISAPGPVLAAEDLEHSDIRLGGVSRSVSAPGPTATLTVEPGDMEEGGTGTIRLRPGSLESLEEEIIRWSMIRHNGSRQEVCAELGLSRTTLWKKLKKMGMEASWG